SALSQRSCSAKLTAQARRVPHPVSGTGLHSLISVSFLSSWLFDGSFYSNSSILVQCAGQTSAYNSKMLLRRNFLENIGIAENASMKIWADLWHDGQPLQIGHMVPCVFDPCRIKGRSHL